MLLAGVFTPVLMLVLSIPVMAVLGYAGWRALAGWPGGKAPRLPGGSAPWWSVIAVIAIAVAFGVDQMIFHSQFIIITRDPASYIQFGAWISGHGSLPIPQDNAAFGFSHDVSFQSAAYYQVGRTVVPQFMAGLPMVLAGGFWIHGATAAVAMAPILGACALLTFGGLVARLVGPRWAPLATLALALALPLQFTSRSTYSEPLAAILFLGGLCLVVDCLAADGRAGRILAGTGRPGARPDLPGPARRRQRHPARHPVLRAAVRGQPVQGGADDRRLRRRGRLRAARRHRADLAVPAAKHGVGRAADQDRAGR